MDGITREPARRCVGCGRTAPKRALVRYAVVDRKVVADSAEHLPGRGAYTCSNGTCLEQAIARRAFSRAFRGPVIVAPENVHLSRGI
jgi:uncharacterized protein